jgi:hypothetical protein
VSIVRIAVPDFVAGRGRANRGRGCARDLPNYDPTISEAAVDGLNCFTQASGLARRSVPYNQIVAREFRHLWTA